VNVPVSGDFRKRISRKSSKSFQLLPCACEMKWYIYFQKSLQQIYFFRMRYRSVVFFRKLRYLSAGLSIGNFFIWAESVLSSGSKAMQRHILPD